MKLKDWADLTGVRYLTAYRWFKDGKLPVPAYQTESGTIIVQDEAMEKSMLNNNTQLNNDIISLILKKTVELSKSNASIEDFAAYILSNFSLKLNHSLENPRYSGNKPNSDEIQKHFQKFLKPKGEKPKPHMLILEVEEFNKLTAVPSPIKRVDENVDLNKELINLTPNVLSIFDATTTDNISTTIMGPAEIISSSEIISEFKPTQKEIESVSKAMEKVADQLQVETSKIRKDRKSLKRK